MENWLRNQCDIYNYRAHSFKLSSTIKSFFKATSAENEEDHLRYHLIEERHIGVTSNKSNGAICKENHRNNGKKRNNLGRDGKSLKRDENSSTRLWRSLSLQGYKKRKQQKQEEKSKPVLPAIEMVMRSLFTGMFVLTSLYLLLAYQFGISLAAPGGSPNQETHRPRSRTLGRFSRPIQYARLKPEQFINDFIVTFVIKGNYFNNMSSNDIAMMTMTSLNSQKRQTNDDYGHLRFGKRGEEIFDDYGHMRFGRSGDK
ncbi:hypothetical protein NQ318_007413 [Aromia moschata]|uniref:Uncharacterized protein n=1 Tax=Aromia moschata TaxID=1265417 RepID=A0AAV8YLX0_9CUCU|nr:hypothetical protein NQ318_007413 [Aromia moschata]